MIAVTKLLKFSALALLSMLAACGKGPEPELASAPAPEGESREAAEDAPTEAADRAPRQPVRLPEPVLSSQPALAPGHHWYLVDASSTRLATQSSRTGFPLHVRETLLAGQSGCNRFDATLAYDADGKIRIGNPASTRRICQDDAINAAEREYLRTLPQMRLYHLMGQRLRLESEDGTVWLEYEHGRRPQGTPLAP